MEPSLSHSAPERRYTSMDAQPESVPLLSADANFLEFEEIFRAYYPRIARLITRIVKDAARGEELSVEVLHKFLRRHRGATIDAGGWLRKTAVRVALDELRRQSRREKYERLFSLSRPVEIHPHTAEDSRECVRRILTVIDKRAAELLILRSEGLSYEELAASLGLNPTSVGTLLRRAQDSFRKEYIQRYGKP
jgi:RNA polymerase sigma-70 factor (ECF subfamily)